MRTFFALAAAAIIAPATYSQSHENPMLSARDSAALYERSVQLIESTSATVPGLARAAAPVLENARQAYANLQSGPAGHSGLIYDLLINIRAYLSLADSLPKPYPFPEEGRKQFAELRDNVERIESHFRATLDQKERQLRSPDRDNLRRYADADAKLPKPAAGEKRIVFLGDSITDGWRLNEYFPNRDFINRGISGQVTGEMLGRMKADVIDLKPAAMLVLAGTNDIARGTALATIENNLTMIADLADVYKIKPMFASVLPISDYHKDVNPRYEMSKVRPPASIVELNRWIEAFCKQRRYVYVDYFSKMVDETGHMKTDLADDGLHPNSAGYRIMAPLALEAIDKNILRPAVVQQPAPAVSSTPARRVKPRAKPTPQVETVQSTPATPATPPPPPAVISKTPAPATTPAPAVTTPAPSTTPAASTPPPAATPVQTSQAPRTKQSAAKPAAKKTEASKKEAPKDEAADAAAPKKKKESFWKRTYPDPPPKY